MEPGGEWSSSGSNDADADGGWSSSEAAACDDRAAGDEPAEGDDPAASEAAAGEDPAASQQQQQQRGRGRPPGSFGSRALRDRMRAAGVDPRPALDPRPQQLAVVPAVAARPEVVAKAANSTILQWCRKSAAEPSSFVPEFVAKVACRDEAPPHPGPKRSLSDFDTVEKVYKFLAEAKPQYMISRQALADELGIHRQQVEDILMACTELFLQAYEACVAALIGHLTARMESEGLRPVLASGATYSDETPGSLRFDPEAGVLQFQSSTTKGLLKIFEMEEDLLYLFQTRDGQWECYLVPLPCPPVGCDRCTAETIFVMTRAPSQFPCREPFEEKFLHRTRWSAWDKASSNEKHEVWSQLKEPDVSRGKMHCTIHLKNTVIGAGQGLCENLTSGMLAVGLTFKQVGALKSFQACLTEVLLKKKHLDGQRPASTSRVA